MNTKTEAMELMLAPAPPHREIEEYAMAAHSTLEKELVRALNEARQLQVRRDRQSEQRLRARTVDTRMKHPPIDVPAPLLSSAALHQLQRDMVMDFYRRTPHDIALGEWRALGWSLARWARRRRSSPAITLAAARHELTRPEAPPLVMGAALGLLDLPVLVGPR